MFQFKKAKWVALTAIALVGMVGIVGCGNNDTKKASTKVEKQVEGSITVVGSTALQPLVEQAAKDFQLKNPKAQITVQGGGSGTGLTQVSQGGAQIGDSDIFAEEKTGIDASAIVDHKVAVVGFAAVVNPNVTVTNLTQQQLIDIFTGKTTNWKQVGGQDQKIVVINRAKGSGTRASFKKWALKGTEEVQGLEQDSSGTVQKMVNETPGAISYLALSYVNDKVKALKLDGLEANKENITAGKYPVWSYEHMYTKGTDNELAKALIDYMISKDVQSNLVSKLGYIPVTEMKVERTATSK